ncbi:MAG: hypothetical protein EXS36_16375 [Pedosphaera sp.]|nr:hypothetical protein [Pedosphaera sp.]
MADGQLAAAVSVFQEALRLRREAVVLAGLGYALARSGQKEVAAQILGELHERREDSERTHQFFVSPFHLAFVYAGMGDNRQALDWLDKGFEERTFLMVKLKVHPAFDGLRNEPRFQALVERMNFPP